MQREKHRNEGDLPVGQTLRERFSGRSLCLPLLMGAWGPAFPLLPGPAVQKATDNMHVSSTSVSVWRLCPCVCDCPVMNWDIFLDVIAFMLQSGQDCHFSSTGMFLNMTVFGDPALEEVSRGKTHW